MEYVIKKIIIGFVLIIILILSVNKTDAASFRFSNTGAIAPYQCSFRSEITINPEDKSSNAGEVEIHYDPSSITILDDLPDVPGTQVLPGNAYESYFVNDVDTTNGIIKIAAASFSGVVTTEKTFAYIDFLPKESATNVQFTIKYDGLGATGDSNIADSSTNLDLLSSVINGHYSFGGSCTTTEPTDTANTPPDTHIPVVTFVSPTKAQTRAGVNPTIHIRISDNGNLNLDSLRFLINDIVLKYNDSQITYTHIGPDYDFYINLNQSLEKDSLNLIGVSGIDGGDNKFINASYFFTTDKFSIQTSEEVSTETKIIFFDNEFLDKFATKYSPSGVITFLLLLLSIPKLLYILISHLKKRRTQSLVSVKKSIAQRVAKVYLDFANGLIFIGLIFSLFAILSIANTLNFLTLIVFTALSFYRINELINSADKE